MPLSPFTDIVALPSFQELTFEKKAEVAQNYWRGVAQEDPQPAPAPSELKLDQQAQEASRPQSYADQQYQDSMRFLKAQEGLKNATPIQARFLNQDLADSATALAVRQNVKAGKMTHEEGVAFAKQKSEERAAETEALKKTASLFDPEVDKEMRPAWQALEKSASNGQYFDEQGVGTKLYNAAADVLPGGQSYDKTAESRKFYEKQRNELATQFNLQPAEVDDLVRHRLGKQKDAISRDAAGAIHVKDELLVKPVEELSTAIETSNLSPATKAEALVQAPFKIAQFKEGVVQNVQKNHPELAADIKWTGDVSKDYVAVTDMLNSSRTEQAVGGAAAHVLDRSATFSGRQQTEMGDFVPAEQMSPQDAREGAQRLAKKQEAINALSAQINQDKVKILGTDAATVGQGVASVAESMVIAGATGGLGNALISADRIAKAGKVGAALLKFGQGAANIAPTAGIYGVDQGLSTYEQAMASDDPAVRARAGELALKSGLIEAVVTTVFSGFGAGGAETMAQRLMSGELRREAAKSMGQAWRNLGKNLIEVPLHEIPEETLITALDSVHVQKQLNPQMTDADVKKAIYDTMVSTLISTAPMGVFNAAKEAKKDFSKKTHEQDTEQLHDQSDATYQAAAKENVPEAKTEGRAFPSSGPVSLAEIERERAAQIELAPTEEEKQAIKDATPEELAGHWGVDLKKQITARGIEIGASKRRSDLLRKKEGREPMPGEARSITDAPQELTKSEQEELDFLEKNSVGDNIDHNAIADFYGVDIKPTTKVNEKQTEKSNPPEAPPTNNVVPVEPNITLPGKTPAADIVAGGVLDETKADPTQDVKYTRDGPKGPMLDGLEFIADTSESVVYRDGDTVVKVSEPYNDKSESTYQERIANRKLIDSELGDGTLQQDGHYLSDNGTKNPIFRQKFVEGREATEQEIDDHMASRGYQKQQDGSYTKTENGKTYTATDLTDGNVFVDAEGNSHVIDANLSEKPSEPSKAPAAETTPTPNTNGNQKSQSRESQKADAQKGQGNVLTPDSAVGEAAVSEALTPAAQKRQERSKGHTDTLAENGVDVSEFTKNPNDVVTQIELQPDGSFEVRIEHHTEDGKMTAESVNVKAGESLANPGHLQFVPGQGTVVIAPDGTTRDPMAKASTPAATVEPTAENALAEIARLVAVVPEGVAQPVTAQPKLVQGTLFQKGDKPRVSDTDYEYPIAGAITKKVNSRKDVSGKVLTPVLRNISTDEVYTGHMHASAFVKAEENNDSGIFESGFMTDDGEYFRKYEDSSANQNNLWEVNQKLTKEQEAELKKIEDSGDYFQTAEQVRNFRTSLRKSSSQRLFQSPESKGDPNAVNLVRSYKGSPPKGATRALIDYAGAPLLSDLGDLPAHTVRDIKEADQIIQATTGKNGKAKLGRVGFNSFLSKLWKRHHRGKSPGWHNFQSRRDVREMGKILSFEIAHALSKDGSGVDWYRAKIDGMYAKLATRYPELGQDTEARFLFSVMLAVTSNGQTVLENLRDTVALYERIRGTNRLPLNAKTSRSERGAAVQKAFREVNALLNENSWQDVKRELLAPVTVSELKKKYGLQITGELADHTVIGAMILGPKIGSFWGNLNGHYDSITMDLWFTRTMNRLSGDTATISPESLASSFKALAEFPGLPVDVYNDIKKYIKDLENSEKSWVRVPSDIREELEHLYGFAKKTYGQYASSGFTDRSDFNKTVQKIVKELDGGEDTPDNGKHRQWMRSVVGAAQSELQKAGVKLTNADLQAILWFHEKDLYTRFGATTNRGERTDYDQAAGQLVERPGSLPQRTSDPGGQQDAGKAGPARSDKQLTLFQGEEKPKGFYQPGVQGAAQATIGFMDSADASTGVHEYWHDLAENDFFGILTPEEVKVIRDWETDGTGNRDTKAKEKGARGWERFLFEGTSTGFAEVDAVLAKLSEWLQSIYQGIKGSSLNVEISPEVRAIMEKLVTRAARGEEVVVTPTKVVREAPKPAKKKLPPRRSAPTLFGPRRALTDAVRARHGIPESQLKVSKTDQEALDEATLLVAQTEARLRDTSLPKVRPVGDALVQTILDNPESYPDKTETALLLHESIQRENKLDIARKDLESLPADATPGDVQAAANEVERARDSLKQVLDVLQLRGSRAGLALQGYKQITDRQFNRAIMESDFLSWKNDKKNGTPGKKEKLTKEEEAYVKKAHADIEAATKRLKELEDQLSEAALREAALIKKLEEKRASVRAPSKPEFVSKVKERADALRPVLARFQRLSQKSERLYQEEELTPDELEAFAAVGAEYLANGARTLDQFTAKLTEEFPGAEVFAEQIFNAAQGSFKTTASSVRVKTPTELVNLLDKENPQISNKLIYNMARGFINQGLGGRDVLDAVTKALNDEFPDLTREEVADAFTGYGKVKYPSMEKDLKQLREIRELERVQRQIDDILAGNPPKQTGMQRDPQTDAVSALVKRRNDLLKSLNIKNTVQKGQLRSTFDAIKSRLSREFREFDSAITKLEKKAARVKTKFSPEEQVELDTLRAKRDARHADYNKVFGIDVKYESEQKRTKAALKFLNARIAEEEAMLKAGILKRVASKNPRVVTPAEKALRAKLDSMTEARHAAEAALHPKKTAEERALERAIKDAEKGVLQYEEILKTGTFPVKGSAVAFTPTTALNALWSQRKALKAAVDQLRRNKRARLTPQERARRQAVAQLTKTIAEIDRRINTGDFSTKTKKPGLAALLPDVVALKKQRDSLRATEKAMKKATLPYVDPEARRDAALVRASQTRKARIEARIAADDYVDVPKVTRAESKALIQVRFEERQVKEQWLQNRQKWNLKNRGKLGKLAYAGHSVLQFRKVLILGLDLLLFRQGMVSLLNRPFRTVRNLVRAIKSFREADELDVYDSIVNPERNPYARYHSVAKQLKFFGPFEEGFKNKEDLPDPEILNRLAKVPGLGTAAQIMLSLERINRVHFNLMANDAFNALLSIAPENAPTKSEILLAANAAMTNVARGSFKNQRAETGIELANYALLSTRYYVGRAKLVTLEPIWSTRGEFSGTLKMRSKIAFQMYGVALFNTALVMSLIARGFIPDDDEREDFISPTSSNFGTFKVNGARYELLGSVRPFVNLLTRFVTGHKVVDGKIEDLTKAQAIKPDLDTEWSRFWANRRNINLNLGLDIATRTHFDGTPVTLKSALVQSVMNINLKTDFELIRELGADHPIQAAVSIAAVHASLNVRAKDFEKKPKKSEIKVRY